MKKKLLLIICTFAVILTPQVYSQTDTIEMLKKHYEPFYENSNYLIYYNQVRYTAYQSYDFRIRDKQISLTKIGIDLSGDTFFAERKSFYPGGYLFEFNEFQKGKESFGFDENGVLYGKRLFEQPASRIVAVKKEFGRVVDFAAVKSLFEKDAKIELGSSKNKNRIVVKKISDDKTSITFTFNKNPIYLVSTHSKPSNTTREYSNYKNIGGLQYAASITQRRNDKFQVSYFINTLKHLKSIDKEKLQKPFGYSVLKDESDSELKAEEISKNLFLIKKVAGDRNVLFSVKGDEIIVFGSPISNNWSKKVIAVIRKKLPKKQIKYVYVTHFHSDHIGGLEEYANADISILTDDFTIQAIKSHTRLGKIPSDKFRKLENGETINGVRFYSIENEHAKGQSFAYFANEKIIYQGDFLEIPFDNTIPTYMPQATKTFIEFLTRKKLNYNRIVGHHRNADISKTLVEQYFNKYAGN